MRKVLFILTILFFGEAMAEGVIMKDEDLYKIQVNGISFLAPKTVKELGRAEQEGKGLFVGVTYLDNLSHANDPLKNSSGMVRIRVTRKEEGYTLGSELDKITAEWVESGVQIMEDLKETYKVHPLEPRNAVNDTIVKAGAARVPMEYMVDSSKASLLINTAETQDKLISITFTIPLKEENSPDYGKIAQAFQIIASTIN